MKKNVEIKLQIVAGKANPAPPIGPALGQHGVNIAEFCKQFNDRTKNEEQGMVLPVVITIHPNKSFSFIVKAPPVSNLIKKYMNIDKGSSNPGREVIGEIKCEQIDKIVSAKLSEMGLEPGDEGSARKVIEGTARSMGVKVVD